MLMMTGPRVRHMRALWNDLVRDGREKRRREGETKCFQIREPEECEESGGAPDCGGDECHLVSLVGTSAAALMTVVLSFQHWV